MNYLFGQLSTPVMVEVKAAAQQLPDSILNSNVTQISIQVVSNADTLGSIVYSYAGLVPASGSAINATNYPFLTGFTNLPPIVGFAAGPGDRLEIRKADIAGFRFCLMSDAPVWLTVCPTVDR